MPDAYPLQWPVGRARWNGQREYSKFKMPTRQMQTELFESLDRLGATDIIVSSNKRPYSRSEAEFLDDPGVAVYFKRKGQELCIACDKYLRISDNLHAIGIAIESFRSLERHGTGEMVDAAFRGFTALPESIIMGAGQVRAWHEVLEVSSDASPEVIRASYRSLSAKYHPDNRDTGNEAKFCEVQEAYNQVKK